MIEINAFGPGFGEAIVVKVANSFAFQVDCCRPAATFTRHLTEVEQIPLSFLLLTHPHYDHYQEIEQVLDLPFEKVARFDGMHALELKNILERRSGTGHNQTHRDAKNSFTTFQRFWDGADASRIRRVTADSLLLRTKVDWMGETVTFQALAIAPDEAGIRRFNAGLAHVPFSETKGEGAQRCNDASVVIVVNYGETRLLLTGDITGSLWASLNCEPVNILKLPHHGSSRDNSSALVRALLKSEGDRTIFVTPYLASKLPDPELLASFEEEFCRDGSCEILLTHHAADNASMMKDWPLIAADPDVRAKSIDRTGEYIVITYDHMGKRVSSDRRRQQ